MLYSIIFIILLIPSLVYAKGEWDYNNVYPKLNDIEYLKKIKPHLFLSYNNEYIETNKPDEEKLKKVLQCWDAIYYAQLKTYDYNHKIQYYMERARIITKYSEKESIESWKKYLYIAVPANDLANKKDIPITAAVMFIPTAIKVLKKYDVSNKKTDSIDDYNYWKENIYNDEVLKKEFDINDNVFKKSK